MTRPLSRIAVVLGASLILAPPLPAQDSAAPAGYSVGPAPAWVEPLKADFEQPHPFQDSIRPGVFFRLVEYHANAETGEEYHHFVDEFLSVAGVHDDSGLEIEFDPAYQRLIIHRLLRHRKGETTDLLGDDCIRLSVSESERAEGLLDGHVTALILPRDLRPGDAIEYDYTVAGRNPAFDGHFFDIVPLEWETTVGLFRYRLLKSPERPLFHRAKGASIEPTKRESGIAGLEEWIWTRKNVPPRLLEDQLPEWFRPFARIELSEFADWNQVARWGARHYDFSAENPDPDLSRLIESIRTTHATPEARALAALRHVQDSVRYLGIEDGAAAFQPSAPNLCHRRRFGDCKDKTALLRQILAGLGIESDPLCVPFAGEKTLEGRLPSPLAFDHIVCRIRMPDGATFFCDPTASHQGGTLRTLAFPDFGKGLVLSPDSTGLIDLPKPDAEASRVETIDTFRFQDAGEPATLAIESVHHGAEADQMRYQIESLEPAALQAHFLDFYREKYDDLEPDGPIEVSDDREKNHVTIREKYCLPQPWTRDPDDRGWYSMNVILTGIREQLVHPDHTRRTMPLAIGEPVNRRHEIRMHLPGTDEEWEGYFDEEKQTVRTKADIFERWMTYDPKKVEATVTATYRSGTDHVEPAQMAEFSSAMEKTYDLTAIELWDENDRESTPASMAAEAPLPEEETLSADEKMALGFAIGFGAIFAGAIGFGLGAAVVYFAMRARAANRHPSPAPSPPRRSPPPLPPAASS